MKEKLRLAVAFFLILALLLAASPASAGAVKTPVTGTMIFLGEPTENPKSREWSTGRLGWLVYQCRLDYQQYEIISTDERLSGVNDGTTSCTFKWNLDGSLDYAILWGKSTVYTNPDFTDPKWECSSNARIDSQWNFTSDAVCRGVGENFGLMAKLTFASLPDYTYAFEGFILEPGGE